MSGIRESAFECTYASGAQRRSALVRAWDDEEAIDLFACELQDEGVEEPGEISVRGSGELPRRRSTYRPRR